MPKGLIRSGISIVAGLAILVVGIKLWNGAFEEDQSGLPRLGQAPEFSLSDEKGGLTKLADLRGQVVLVNFMFTRCFELCPLLTDKLASVQAELAEDNVEDVYFISISVDPDYDRPDILKEFAEAMGYRPESWAFLTGQHNEIEDVANAYGVVMAKEAESMINHNLLTTVVDRKGVMRVQYLGERFDPNELLNDIRSLAGGSATMT